MAKRYRTIKQYAHALLQRTVRVDEDGRKVGYSYIQILAFIKRRFPTVTYRGPHTGRATRITVEELRQIAWQMWRNDPAVRLPVRPRTHKQKRKTKVK
jgi:hypothetical protein